MNDHPKQKQDLTPLTDLVQNLIDDVNTEESSADARLRNYDCLHVTVEALKMYVKEESR